MCQLVDYIFHGHFSIFGIIFQKRSRLGHTNSCQTIVQLHLEPQGFLPWWGISCCLGNVGCALAVCCWAILWFLSCTWCQYLFWTESLRQKWHHICIVHQRLMPSVLSPHDFCQTWVVWSFWWLPFVLLCMFWQVCGSGTSWLLRKICNVWRDICNWSTLMLILDQRGPSLVYVI